MLKNSTNTTAFKTTRRDQRLIFNLKPLRFVFPKENPASFEVLFSNVSIIKV